MASLKYKESWVSNNNPMLSLLLLSNCKILITYILFTCILFTCLLFTCILITCTHTHMLTFICPHITGILTCLLFTCTLLITSTPISYSHTHHMYTLSMYAPHILTHHLHAHHIIKICILHTQLQGKMPGCLYFEQHESYQEESLCAASCCHCALDLTAEELMS